MRKKDLIKAGILLFGLLLAFLVWRFTPLQHYVSLENATRLARIARELGWIAPLLYLLFYAIGTVLLLPGSVMSVVGGLTFGVYWGTVMVSIGTTIGSALAFLTARYFARPLVERLVCKRTLFHKLDEGVARHGWRMVMVVRIVPVFPYMFVNYALGLTKIPFWTYVGVTWLCMLPSSFAICLASGSLVSGGDDWKMIFLYLLLAGLMMALIATLPLLISKRLRPDLTEQLTIHPEE